MELKFFNSSFKGLNKAENEDSQLANDCYLQTAVIRTEVLYVARSALIWHSARLEQMRTAKSSATNGGNSWHFICILLWGMLWPVSLISLVLHPQLHLLKSHKAHDVRGLYDSKITVHGCMFMVELWFERSSRMPFFTISCWGKKYLFSLHWIGSVFDLHGISCSSFTPL